MVLLFLVSELYVLSKYDNGLVLLLWMESADDKFPSCWLYNVVYACFDCVITTCGGPLFGY
jgi:hypothetical protein